MNKDDILSLKHQAFDKQREVIRCQAKRIVLFVGRRGAKTSTIVLLFLMYALLHDNIRLVFIGLTGETAENAFHPHAIKFLKTIGLELDRDFTFNKTERLFTFHDTNSQISLKGYDMSYKEMDKILGGKAFAVAIDECQSHTQDIEKAILYKIQPAVSDYLPVGGGLIILSGTAGDYMGENFWYRICDTPNHLGWTMFSWLDKDNPHMLQAKLMEDAEFKRMYGDDFQELDWYQQQYLCKWIRSGIRKVYQVDQRNYLGMTLCKTDRLPKHMLDRGAGAVYGLGMDWGFSPDPMAFLVLCYNTKYSDKCYVIEEYKQKEMYLSDIDDKIVALNKRYNFSFIVSDAGAQTKQSVEDLNNNYGSKNGYFVMGADKAGKLAHQNTLNSDLRAGRLLIDPIACPQLINELENLIWDPIKLNTQNKREEKEGLANHLCDSLLYIHNHCRHLWYQAPVSKWTPTTPEEHNLALVKELMGRDKPQKLYSDINFAVPNRRSNNVRRY